MIDLTSHSLIILSCLSFRKSRQTIRAATCWLWSEWQRLSWWLAESRLSLRRECRRTVSCWLPVRCWPRWVCVRFNEGGIQAWWLGVGKTLTSQTTRSSSQQIACVRLRRLKSLPALHARYYGRFLQESPQSLRPRCWIQWFSLDR